MGSISTSSSISTEKYQVWKAPLGSVNKICTNQYYERVGLNLFWR